MTTENKNTYAKELLSLERKKIKIQLIDTDARILELEKETVEKVERKERLTEYQDDLVESINLLS